MRTRAALLMLTTVVSGWAGHPQSSAPKRNDPAQMVIANTEGFRINLTLSDKAKKLLTERRETIIVVAYVFGKPKPGIPALSPEEMGEPKGTVGLGDHEIEIAPGGNVQFGEFQMKRAALALVDADGPQLLINVVSGRKSSNDNLLGCDDYEAPLGQVEGKTIAISCKLIAEIYPSFHSTN